MFFVFAVKDTVVGTFMRPWFASHKALAVRAFTDEVNRSSDDNSLFKHPMDFDLYEIGQFDEVAGELICCPPALVTRGISVIQVSD